MVWIALIASLAAGQDGPDTSVTRPADVSVGLATIVNDPYLHRRGLSLGASLSPSRRLGLGLELSILPSLGEADYTSRLRTKQAADPSAVVYLTRMVGRGVAAARYWPLEVERDGTVARAGVELAVGAAYTVDDDAHNGHSVSSISRQVHPYAHGGLVAEYRRNGFGMRMRFAQGAYPEVYRRGDILRHHELRVPLSVSADLLVIPRGWPRSPPDR